jgi:Predicted periplasmic protein
MRKFYLLLRAPLRFGVAVALLPALAQEPVPPESHRMPLARKFSYACDGNVTVDVTLRGERARVVCKDKTYSMTQVKSGSGARYAQGSVVWWNKGYGGFLQDESDPNHPVMLAENCKQTSPTPTPR